MTIIDRPIRRMKVVADSTRGLLVVIACSGALAAVGAAALLSPGA
jgi:hypothetical protein